MARRRVPSNTPLTQKQRELAERENDLRRQMDDLQRMIEEAPRVAAETTRRRQEELFDRASSEGQRLDVFSKPADKRYGEDLWDNRRPRSLRKERREGRLLFIVLVLALSAAVIWIATHLHF
ncbi:MAG TPA: hypothetical protein VHW03_08575 [Chthoniobacterales bacterium]|jgi:hypothetical protein|nr:hypothetical protein [Chthoniobacterales bacterium]